MGRLKHYQHCEVIIAPEGDEAACTVGDCEDEMVHQELKKCNSRNELGKQNNGKRFLTDKEIKALKRHRDTFSTMKLQSRQCDRKEKSYVCKKDSRYLGAGRKLWIRLGVYLDRVYQKRREGKT